MLRERLTCALGSPPAGGPAVFVDWLGIVSLLLIAIGYRPQRHAGDQQRADGATSDPEKADRITFEEIGSVVVFAGS